MKIVLDANIVVAAFASRGLCESIFEFCLSEQEIISCADLVDEIARALREKIGLPAGVVDDIRSLLLEHCTLFEPVPLPPEVCRDPDDVKVLGTAVAASANFIVTGDKDLLVLKAYHGVPILSPRAFSELIHTD